MARKLLKIESIQPFRTPQPSRLESALKAFSNRLHQGKYIPSILSGTLQELIDIARDMKIENPEIWAKDVFNSSEMHEIIECAHKNNKPKLLAQETPSREEERILRKAKEVLTNQIVSKIFASRVNQQTLLTSTIGYLTGDIKLILSYSESLKVE